jgi:PAB1-binding protein PBP1
MTDSEISNRELKERELVPWKPSDGIVMEDLTSGSTRNWDQFAVNRDKFGVTTTWDERIYTTDLDRDSAFYRKNIAKAEKIAAEIERVS